MLLETGYDYAAALGVTNRGHKVEYAQEGSVFGGAQLVYRMANGGYCGASDHRKEGGAVGF